MHRPGLQTNRAALHLLPVSHPVMLHSVRPPTHEPTHQPYAANPSAHLLQVLLGALVVVKGGLALEVLLAGHAVPHQLLLLSKVLQGSSDKGGVMESSMQGGGRAFARPRLLAKVAGRNKSKELAGPGRGICAAEAAGQGCRQLPSPS